MFTCSLVPLIDSFTKTSVDHRHKQLLVLTIDSVNHRQFYIQGKWAFVVCHRSLKSTKLFDFQSQKNL